MTNPTFSAILARFGGNEQEAIDYCYRVIEEYRACIEEVRSRVEQKQRQESKEANHATAGN